ncbi:PHP domain-containing protein [Ruoffia sp. FAM 20858]|uniref:PHP domain-containing protein n=1 Tax=Ruoffia sp. FAM 20858 TaxID=3259516 RepID=UPI003887B177
MQYYDQHLHTYYSPDSKEEFENYLSQSELPVVTTEHIDFYSPNQSHDDVIPDYEGYSKKIEELNQEFNNRLLRGIEIGFTYADRDKIEQFLEGKDYDIKLLSIHHNGRHGFMTLNHDVKDLKTHLEEYFGLMLEAVRNAPYANVLAHFDFGLRGYDNVKVEDLHDSEDLLLQIFETMVSNGQALELNTRSMYRYDNDHLYDYAIDLYKSVGGDMFTVSSDAHVAGDYQLGFEEAFNKLRNHDVNQLVVFQKGVPHYVDIPQ